MTQQQYENRKERAENEPLVIARTDEGFRVYSPTNRIRSYIVSGSVQAPSCTCPDFQYHDENKIASDDALASQTCAASGRDPGRDPVLDAATDGAEQSPHRSPWLVARREGTS